MGLSLYGRKRWDGQEFRKRRPEYPLARIVYKAFKEPLRRVLARDHSGGRHHVTWMPQRYAGVGSAVGLAIQCSPCWSGRSCSFRDSRACRLVGTWRCRRPSQPFEGFLHPPPRARAGGGCGGKTSEADQTLRELSQAQQDGGLIPLSAIESIKRLSSDRTFVLAAVQMNDNALAYVSEEMQADREVVLAAVRQTPRALAYVSADLCADRTIVLAAVEKNPFVLQYASAELRADREVMLAAVQQAGVALQHASAELQADPEIVLVALKQDQGAIRYASAELHASGHPFGHLDTLADCGQLKVLRSLRSVLDCGDQMQNCFRDFEVYDVRLSGSCDARRRKRHAAGSRCIQKRWLGPDNSTTKC